MSRRLSNTILAALLGGAFAGPALANPITLVNDPFTDGGVTNGADPSDIAYFRTGGSTALSVPTLGTGLTGNALRYDPAGNTFAKFLGFFPDADANSLQELAVGDVLELRFDIRFETAPGSVGSGLRFGLFNSNDTQQTDDFAGNAGSNFNGRIDDRGYFFGMNVGTNATSGTDLFEESDADGSPLGGAITGVSNVFDSINAGTTAFSLRFKIERTAVSQLSLGLSINGGALESVFDNTPVTTAFDTVVIGQGNQAIPFLVDNVNVAYTAVPEPATLALAGVGAALVLGRRRTA